jgi:hypothetical protein
MEDLYCKIYVNTDMSKKMFLDFIAQTINGSIELRTVCGPFFEVDVVNNPDAEPLQASEQDDGFLYYPYYLDVEPLDNTKRESYIASISRLLRALWNIGAKAVAACDFEDELPYKTGARLPYEIQLALPKQPPKSNRVPNNLSNWLKSFENLPPVGVQGTHHVEGLCQKATGDRFLFAKVGMAFSPSNELIFEESLPEPLKQRCQQENWLDAISCGVLDIMLAATPITLFKCVIDNIEFHEIDSSPQAFRLAARYATEDFLRQSEEVKV